MATSITQRHRNGRRHADAVVALLDGQANVRDVVGALLARPIKHEAK
jgi:hypothetical protein